MSEEELLPLVVLAGPTASGKTALAAELAIRLNGEVVSADSMQIYQDMQIATAKPDQEEMRGVPHHLIDFLPPDNASFSVAQYVKLAHGCIAQIAERQKLPILAGGTGLYINSVVDGINYKPFPDNQEIRNALRLQAEQYGAEEMFRRLAQVDPELTQNLHPNNVGRVLRALEVYQLTGIPMSEHQRRSRLTPPRYRLCMLGIDFSDRALLYQRINKRVDVMLERGLLEEARRIASIYGGTARQAIGYKELQPFLDGALPLEVCVEKLKQATRHYAKRQLTWFRRDKRIQWLFVDRFTGFEEMCSYAQNMIHKSGILWYNHN